MASIRTTVDLVLIPVVVTDKQDRLITGLEKDHFKLFEDKVEQVITHFVTEDAPASIALVFDSSGSMGPKLQKSRAAVAAFLKDANPEDEFALIAVQRPGATAVRFHGPYRRDPEQTAAVCNPKGAPRCSMRCTWR